MIKYYQNSQCHCGRGGGTLQREDPLTTPGQGTHDVHLTSPGDKDVTACREECLPGVPTVESLFLPFHTLVLGSRTLGPMHKEEGRAQGTRLHILNGGHQTNHWESFHLGDLSPSLLPCLTYSIIHLSEGGSCTHRIHSFSYSAGLLFLLLKLS